MTDRFGHGVVLVQNLGGPRFRDTRLREGEVALVTWVRQVKEPLGGGDCDVLFKGEVWRANTIGLRVVSDG